MTRGAKRDANADLPGAATHGVGDHAVEADHREDASDDGEQAHQAEGETRPGQLLVQVGRHGADFGHGDLVVHREQRGPNRLRQIHGVGLGADDDVHLPVGPGPPPGVEIDRGVRILAKATVVDVVNDAHDSELLGPSTPGVGL